MFSLFRKTPAQAFWTWFKKNESLLHDFELDRDTAFAALRAALERYEPELAFEFGPKDAAGQRELVLSANGIKSKFPAVQALVAAAPRLDRWRFTAFRPRRDPMMQMALGSFAIKPEDIDCCLLLDDGELGLQLFFRGWTEALEPSFGHVGFLMLDAAIGEYDVSMKVGVIQFLAFEMHRDAERFPLTELARRFDAQYAQLLH
jgi:hypothetical protein